MVIRRPVAQPEAGGGLADDTLLVGDDTQYGTENDIPDSATRGIWSIDPFTAEVSGTPREGFIYGRSNDEGEDYFLAIYDSGGNLDCQSQMGFYGESNGWQGPFDFTGQGCTDIVESTQYILASGGGFYRYTYFSGAGGGDGREDSGFTGTTASATLSESGTENVTHPWSIYLTNGTEP